MILKTVKKTRVFLYFVTMNRLYWCNSHYCTCRPIRFCNNALFSA